MSGKILNKREMEELMPDYIFGKLSDIQKESFESALPSYPEIGEEVVRAKAVFKRVEQIDVNAILSQKTRNLSVRVNERLARKQSRKSRSGFFVRYVLPIAAVIAIFMFIFSPENENIQNIETAGKINEVENDEIAKAISEINFEEFLTTGDSENTLGVTTAGTENTTAQVEEIVMASTEIQNEINEEFDNFFFTNVSAGDIVKDNNLENMAPLLPASLKIFNDLTDQEFQELLEAMKNEEYI